jgi:hypothetical protein
VARLFLVAQAPLIRASPAPRMEQGGEGCACGPSGSRRKFGDYGPPGSELKASLVVWWREAAGIGEATMMALCVMCIGESLKIYYWEEGRRGHSATRVWVVKRTWHQLFRRRGWVAGR